MEKSKNTSIADEVLTDLNNKIDKLLRLSAAQKEVLTVDEVAAYTGLKKSYIYQLTHRKEIPFYKPKNKVLFFKRTELEAWLLRNRHIPNSEIETEAANYILNNKKG